MEYITDENYAKLLDAVGIAQAIAETEAPRFIAIVLASWAKSFNDETSDFERALYAKGDWLNQHPAAVFAAVFPVLEDYAKNSKIPSYYMDEVTMILPYVTPEFHKLLSDSLAKVNV